MVAGHECWLIGPKLFQPEPYPPTCMSSKLCDFIFIWSVSEPGEKQIVIEKFEVPGVEQKFEGKCRKIRGGSAKLKL